MNKKTFKPLPQEEEPIQVEISSAFFSERVTPINISKVTGRGNANGDYDIIMYAWMLCKRRKFGAFLIFLTLLNHLPTTSSDNVVSLPLLSVFLTTLLSFCHITLVPPSLFPPSLLQTLQSSA